MSKDVVNTGGTKEFRYTKEDYKRIRKSDTHSSREFKKAYNDWLTEKKYNEEQEKKFRFYFVTFVTILFIIFVIYLLSKA